MSREAQTILRGLYFTIAGCALGGAFCVATMFLSDTAWPVLGVIANVFAITVCCRAIRRIRQR